MAFTVREFADGAVMAWAISLAFAVLANGLLALGMIVPVLLIVVPVSAAAALLGAPVAYGLGLVLRGVPSQGIHLAAFAALGAVVAVLAVAIVFRGDTGAVIWVVNAVAGAAGVALGWRRAMTRARRADALIAASGRAGERTAV